MGRPECDFPHGMEKSVTNDSMGLGQCVGTGIIKKKDLFGNSKSIKLTWIIKAPDIIHWSNALHYLKVQ